MQVVNSGRRRRVRSPAVKFGKKILGFALDGYYYFEDDEIEDKIDQAEIRFGKLGRAAIRNFIWSHDKIRAKICQVGLDIYGKV